MNVTTRSSYLDSMTMANNDFMIKEKQQEKLPWYYELYQSIQYLYMQFLLMTTLYVMEPWERILMISIFIFVISLITYSALVYIPFHIHHVLQSTIPSISAVLIR